MIKMMLDVARVCVVCVAVCVMVCEFMLALGNL